jgi:hypothetical protein
MLWMTGLLLTYTLWGGFAVFIGLFMFGVGVVITAFLATLLNGLWSAFFEIIFLVFLTYGTRFMSAYVIDKYERQEFERHLVEE